MAVAVDVVRIENALGDLAQQIDGELHHDLLSRMLYAQDASVYQAEPLGVAFPKSREDVQSIVRMAQLGGFSLVPRAAGTSLAGQCVGEGLVVDTGRHMNQVLELNVEERWVRVQPGVILDDLNRLLAGHGLYFGPDTSTSNRCMIAGMIGNNSCGTHSILYGNTMAHVLELGVVLSDGSFAMLGDWDEQAFREQRGRGDRLGQALEVLDRVVHANRELILERYPRADVLRRNTGYPLDDLANRAPYTPGGQPFSLARFLCGTEGTLAIMTEAKLNLVAKPTKKLAVCVHFNSLEDSLRATVVAVRHNPAAVELIDKRILDQTRHNIEQERNRGWVQGDPEAILAVEFFRDSDEELEQAAAKLIAAFEAEHFGYAYPILRPPHDAAVWNLRKAGLGILMGIEGDVKPVTVVEDTAVAVDVLPDYIRDFTEIMNAWGTACVYYAHASVGELHLRPELNLKDVEDVKRFKGIAEDVADLVRRYRGAISGEHGDGRVRSPLLERFYGSDVMDLHREVKAAFDPQNIFNPGIIVDPKPIDADFRFEPGRPTPEVRTYFNWSRDMGLVRATEKCNGAGACRKRSEAGGTMCPSYMATLDEKDSTRGRANVFRTLLTGADPQRAFESEELHAALDLCISCKGCKSECPANVDMAKMKAEFLQHHYERVGTPWSAYLFGYYAALSRLAGMIPWLANALMSFLLTRWMLRLVFNISEHRKLPAYAGRTFTQLLRSHRERTAEPGGSPEVVWLYVDPFTEYTEPEIAMSALRVLEAAGYSVEILPIADDGRALISKGLVKRAKLLSNRNIARLSGLIDAHPERRVVGLEPSALLTFRDETPDLVDEHLRAAALRFAERCQLFEEFVDDAQSRDRFDVRWLSRDEPELVLHGHCHQKAIVGLGATERVLKRAGYKTKTLPTGCCGMAGSFGYEA
ncbi:MAG: FAD-binding protein, partial [Bradymonadaceae bacterium]|nr:FAD-binding protein [Lujinxingiaceae bacterium]